MRQVQKLTAGRNIRVSKLTISAWTGYICIKKFFNYKYLYSTIFYSVNLLICITSRPICIWSVSIYAEKTRCERRMA